MLSAETHSSPHASPAASAGCVLSLGGPVPTICFLHCPWFFSPLFPLPAHTIPHTLKSYILLAAPIPGQEEGWALCLGCSLSLSLSLGNLLLMYLGQISRGLNKGSGAA